MILTNCDKKIFQQKLSEASSNDSIINLLLSYSEYELKGRILGMIFEKMFINEYGFSDAITMQDLTTLHHSFLTTNGGDWCRSNTSWIGKKYNIIREKTNKIKSIKADGFNKNLTINQNIRNDIYISIKSKKCCILDIGTNIECDHKDGSKDDWRLNSIDLQKVTDFQPLSKTANDAKRQHCKKCKETGIRYDAKALGYSTSYLFGSQKTKTCVGCYWYDPQQFNYIISENYDKKD